MNTRLIALAFGAVVLAACSHEAPEPMVAAAPVTGIEIMVLAPEPVSDAAQFDAALEAIYQSTVAAQTNARVEELPYDVGDYVEKGAVIVRFRGTEQQARAASAQAAVREAEARLVDAQSEYKRVDDLYRRDVLSKSALDKAKATLESTRAQVEAARASAQEAAEQAEYTVVRAPYEGIVVERHIDVGETATVGSPLMTGVSLEHLRAVVDVPQQAIGAVYERKQAQVILPDGRRVEAAGLRIPPSADAATHTFRVLVTLPEGDYGVFPGTLVKVAFVRGQHNALLLPATALVRRSELTAVYVLDDGDVPGLRYVSLGEPTPDGRYPVLSGLIAGERVALDPVKTAQQIKQQAKVGT